MGGSKREERAGFIGSWTIQNSDNSRKDSVLVNFVQSIATATIYLFIET